MEITHLAAGEWSISAQAISADGPTASGNASVQIPAEGEVEIQIALEPR